ncbi:MAG TPA: MaoC/PaaZ C-terminal domain-containing protein, partial [Longimicrobiales bacterium]|nr:MaoC/PaaZ C-terminal domain-containing protein [Longimicrobiales bacterium]
GADLAYLFATTFMEADPLYLSDRDARRAGFERAPVHPLLVLNIALALGVENDSEQALAHLGYYDVRFHQPVYPGATLRSATRVLEVRERGEDEPGVVRVETRAVEDGDGPVLTYERAILVPRRPPGSPSRWSSPAPSGSVGTVTAVSWRPLPGPDWPGPPDFSPGDIVLHVLGRTITKEHMEWSYRLGNTHPLHFDRHFTAALKGPLGGEPVVYGGLVFAWTAGLASRDLAFGALWDLGYDQGYHTAPVRAGDTLYAASRVEEVKASAEGTILTATLVGLRDLPPGEAWQRHGQGLFDQEQGKGREERIAEKCFETRRRLLFK